MSDSDSSSNTSSSSDNYNNKSTGQAILPKSTDNKRPEPGSLEWTNQRKENHKKVERKRREAINSAMTLLGNVIPGEEKNKSKILSKAVEHILDLNTEIASLKSQLAAYQNKETNGEVVAEANHIENKQKSEGAQAYSTLQETSMVESTNKNKNNNVHSEQPPTSTEANKGREVPATKKLKHSMKKAVREEGPKKKLKHKK